MNAVLLYKQREAELVEALEALLDASHGTGEGQCSVERSIVLSAAQEAAETALARKDDRRRLIAAAPDLLDAAADLIADVRRRYPEQELRCEYMRALDAAIAKARGAS